MSMIHDRNACILRAKRRRDYICKGIYFQLVPLDRPHKTYRGGGIVAAFIRAMLNIGRVFNIRAITQRTTDALINDTIGTRLPRESHGTHPTDLRKKVGARLFGTFVKSRRVNFNAIIAATKI